MIERREVWATWPMLLDVVGLVLHRVRHRRLRKTDPGWSVATTMASQLVLDAVEQAIWTRGREGRDLAGLIAHHDHGVQYLSVAYSEHLATAGINPRPVPWGPRTTTRSRSQ
jgi:transposase InsO family protein